MLLTLLSTALAAPPNVLLVVVDALRADRVLGPDAEKLTPNLQRFARRSVVFSHAISSAAWTVPSMASLFTSLDPQVHRALRYNPQERLPDDSLLPVFPTLAESLGGAGYETAALLKAVVLAKNRGFAQGFSSWRVVEGDMADRHSATQLTDAALEWVTTIRNPERPFFLYLHYMDPHSNYLAPEPWYSEARGDYNGPVTGVYNQIQDTYKERGVIPTRRDLSQIVRYYDAEVRYWDSEFGRLIKDLALMGVDSNTIVVVTADHGEALYEHGSFFESNVYQENIAVPLLVKVPGVAAAQRSELVQVLDVAPTLAELTGLPTPAAWQGRSLAPALRGDSIEPRSAYAEYGGIRTLIAPDGMKLIEGDGAAKLFQIFDDPGELRDRVGGGWKELQRLRAQLAERVAGWAAQRQALGL